jgi:uncharacterized protein YjbI with pentapeptide repeats
MLKHFAAFATLAVALSLPSTAQDASEIARVQQGKACQGCNLFQANLAYKDLPGLNASGSRLRQSNMSLTTLDSADLSGANLTIANLYGARLSGTNLSEADLTDAILVGAYLGGANLKGTVLKGANLGGAEITTARGLTQGQLNEACGDRHTRLPTGLTVKTCR